jgi:hypothetical protein
MIRNLSLAQQYQQLHRSLALHLFVRMRLCHRRLCLQQLGQLTSLGEAFGETGCCGMLWMAFLMPPLFVVVLTSLRMLGERRS